MTLRDLALLLNTPVEDVNIGARFREFMLKATGVDITKHDPAIDEFLEHYVNQK